MRGPWKRGVYTAEPTHHPHIMSTPIPHPRGYGTGALWDLWAKNLYPVSVPWSWPWSQARWDACPKAMCYHWIWDDWTGWRDWSASLATGKHGKLWSIGVESWLSRQVSTTCAHQKSMFTILPVAQKISKQFKYKICISVQNIPRTEYT